MSGERVWIPLHECSVLKRKPKKIDFMIPIDYSPHFNVSRFPLNKWIYFAQGNQYWKVRLKGKWAVVE